jgi:hypothetical protein
MRSSTKIIIAWISTKVIITKEADSDEILAHRMIGPYAPAVLSVVLDVAVANIHTVFSSVHHLQVGSMQLSMDV